MVEQKYTVIDWIKGLGWALIIIVHAFLFIGLLNLYGEEKVVIALPLALVVGYLPTIIAAFRKSNNVSRILVWNFIFFPIADILLLNDDDKKTEQPAFICESCNKTFVKPEKTNKFLKICGLLLIYGLIIVGIESISTDDISILLPRFILDMAFIIIAAVHILMTLFKDNGRGKCPHCGAIDFISIDSIKGQNLLKQVNKIKKQEGK